MCRKAIYAVVVVIFGLLSVASGIYMSDDERLADKYGASIEEIKGCREVFPDEISLDFALSVVDKKSFFFGLFGPTCESLKSESAMSSLPVDDFLLARMFNTTEESYTSRLIAEIAEKNGVQVEVARGWVAESGSLRLFLSDYRMAESQGKVYPKDINDIETQTRYLRSLSGFTEDQVSQKLHEAREDVLSISHVAETLLASDPSNLTIGKAIRETLESETLISKLDAAYRKLIELETYNLDWHYRKLLLDSLQIAPRDEMYEKTTEFENRKIAAHAQAKEIWDDWNIQKEAIAAPIVSRKDYLVKELKSNAEEISALEFLVDVSSATWSVDRYDPDSELMYLTFSGHLLSDISSECRSLFQSNSPNISSCQVAISLPISRAREVMENPTALTYVSKFRSDRRIHISDGRLVDANGIAYTPILQVNARIPFETFISSMPRNSKTSTLDKFDSIEYFRALCNEKNKKDEPLVGIQVPVRHRLGAREGSIEIDFDTTLPAIDSCYYRGTVEILPDR